jgi:hypothetical protein
MDRYHGLNCVLNYIQRKWIIVFIYPALRIIPYRIPQKTSLVSKSKLSYKLIVEPISVARGIPYPDWLII